MGILEERGGEGGGGEIQAHKTVKNKLKKECKGSLVEMTEKTMNNRATRYGRGRHS